VSNKYLHYADLSETHGRHVAENPANWTDMLATAARLYKYSFDEQLLIHAQKPDAAACAEIPLWNRPFGRYVKKGTKGIALLDDSAGRQRLRYVFDIADTAEGRYRPRTPYIWQVRPEHEGLVEEALGRPTGEIPALAAELAIGHVEENHEDILGTLEQAGFTDYSAFLSTMADSAAYMIMSRCGLDTSALTGPDSGAFRHIGMFGAPELLKALGEGASTISENVLRDIESTIKKHDRAQARLAQNERRDIHDSGHSQKTDDPGGDNLQPAGGLPDTGHRDTGGRGRTALPDDVGHDAQGLSEEAPPDNLHEPEVGGQVVPALPRNRGTGERADGAADGAALEKDPVPEALKDTDPLAWAGQMNALKARAEEIVKTELIHR